MALSPIAFIAVNYRDFKTDWLKAYDPGTTTPKPMALDSAGATTVAKLQLNADGFLIASGGALVIPYIDGSYDAWLFPTEAEADANDTSNAKRLADNITAPGSALINDLSQAYEFKTLSNALDTSINFPDGKVIHLKEHSAGNGGAGTWHVVLTSLVIPNNIDIVTFTNFPLYSLMFELTHPINLAAIGAVTGVDFAAIATQAVTHGNNILLPRKNGLYTCSTFTIDKPLKFYGEGMGNSNILPITGNSTIVVATDHVEISDIMFIGQTGNEQANIIGSCIEFDAVTNNPAFKRHMEGCKVERVKFLNLKMNGILVSHLLRESHIKECRFLGMGQGLGGNRHGIKFENTKGNASTINNLWIEDNVFYRFNSEAIKGYRSVLLAGSAGSYADIHLKGNLIHGQIVSDPAPGVEPEPTDHVRFQDSISLSALDNTFTSIHPLYQGLAIANIGLFGKTAIVQDNTFSVKSVVDGVTYSRAGPNFATGHAVQIVGSETANIANNEIFAGIFVDDIQLTNGDYATKVNMNVTDNTSEAGSIVVDVASLGLIGAGWSGTIEQSGEVVTTEKQTVHNIFNLISTGFSKIERNTNGLALAFAYESGANAPIIGSPAPNQFQVTSSTGTPYIVVETTNSFRPGADNTRKLGSASFRWSEIFAGNATINTSDETTKSILEELSATEKLVALEIKSNIRKFKFLDSIESKGEENARIHIGVGAQTVKDIFESHGLNPAKYALFCWDEWEDHYVDIHKEVDGVLVKTGREVDVKAGSRYGIRYSQLLAFIISAI